MHLIHVSGERSCGRELSIALFARKMTVFLVLQKNIRIFEFFITVVAEWFEHFHSTFLAPHYLLLQSN
jgi:hypothetical protein